MVALTLSAFVILAVVLVASMAISRKLGAVVLVLYLIGFLLIVTGVLPNVSLGA